MRRRERDGCGTFRFFEVSSRGATAQHTPPRQCREEGRKYSFRRRDTVDAWTRRIANGENFFFEKTPLESKTQISKFMDRRQSATYNMGLMSTKTGGDDDSEIDKASC